MSTEMTAGGFFRELSPVFKIGKFIFNAVKTANEVKNKPNNTQSPNVYGNYNTFTQNNKWEK